MSWPKVCLFFAQFAIYNISHSVQDVSGYWLQCQCHSVIYFFENQTTIQSSGTMPEPRSFCRLLTYTECCFHQLFVHVSCDSVHARCLIIFKAMTFTTSSVTTSASFGRTVYGLSVWACVLGACILRTSLKGSAPLACVSSPFDNGDPYLRFLGPDFP